MSRPSRPVVAVVGGGIAGLAAAWELVAGAESGGNPPEVHVFEVSRQLGGKIRATEFAGRTVDLAADAFLARRPEATDLCAEVGIDDTLVTMGTTGASIWARGRLRAMPAGLNLGVPTRWWPLARSGILSPSEAVRPLLDLVAPHRRSSGAFGDRAVGAIVEERLGATVVERLVDPLVGGIHAGGVDELSAAATFPVLLAASHQAGSLMRTLGRASARAAAAAESTGEGPPPPVFWSLPGSTASLADQVAGALVERGVVIHTRTGVEAVEQRSGGPTGTPRWRLTLGRDEPASGDGRRLDADGVVLAVPAPEAAALLSPLAPDAAGLLGGVAYGSVAVVTLTVPAGAVPGPLTGTGLLVPRTSTLDGRPALTTGVTYLAKKWPHLARPGDELLRVSVGRYGDRRFAALDDDGLIASVLAELTVLIGLRGTATEAMVTRWENAFPQYEVGHLLRVARVEQLLSGLGTVAVAGAALRGVGIPACIGSGRAAARHVRAGLPVGDAAPTP